MEDRSGFNDIAEENSFVACYPQSLGTRGHGTEWNAHISISDEDDIGFLNSLTDHLMETYGLDEDRVYLGGYSSGGIMSYTMALFAPERYRAIAPMGARIYQYDWEHRDMAMPMPIIHIMGAEDKHLDPENSTLAQLSYYAEINGCDEVIRTRINDTVECYAWKNGKDDAEVLFYMINNFGHGYPSEENMSGINAAELIWDFFDQYK